MLFARRVFCRHEARADMASHGHRDGHDGDKRAQLLGEPQPCILKIEAFCFAVSEHALDEPSPASRS